MTFDPARTPEPDVRRWLKLGPDVDAFYAVPEELNRCLDRDPQYAECGTRDWKDKNFVSNANINLGRIRERIKSLDVSAYPPELSEVVSYFKRIQETELFFDSQLLRFFQDWQPSRLAVSYGGVDAGSRCAAEISKVTSVASAKNKDQAYKLALIDWQTCVNRAFRHTVGEYPAAAWKKFLSHYGIRVNPVFEQP